MCARVYIRGVADVPRKYQDCTLVLAESGYAGLDVLNECRGLAPLVAFNEPFCLIPSVVRSSLPNCVPANNNEVVG